MTKPQDSSDGGGSFLVQRTAAWARKLGFKTVPVAPNSKAALTKDYVNLNYESPADDYWNKRACNIGVVTGPQQNGPIDVDLDCPEALFFGPRFLPPTPAVFGRKSNPASHYNYRVDAPSFEKTAFVDPATGFTIIEMRGDGGHQTVFPGSIHQTGEPIEWTKEKWPDVPSTDPVKLRTGVSKVAIATLVCRYCWYDGSRNFVGQYVPGLLYYLDWSEEDTSDIMQAIVDFMGDDDKTRLISVRSTYSKGARGLKIAGAGKLRKLLMNHPVVDKLQEWAGSPTAVMLTEYNERFAVVSIEGKFRIADVDVEPSEQPVFYHKDDFINLMSTDCVEIEGKRVAKPRLWLTNPRRRTHLSVDFLPGIETSGRSLNLWTGWAIEPRKGCCNAWLDLLYSVICGGDKELNNWMLHWLANILRDPRDKPLTAPVIIGPQGAGKSLLIGYFGRILGAGYVSITNEEHIYGRFNRHLAATLLLHSEEALYGGEKKHKGIIKSLITDDSRIFEQKGIDARQVRNYLRLVLTSNDAHAAPAEANDRRFTVIDMAQRKAERPLIEAVIRELKEGHGPAALFDHLLTMPYDPKVPCINVKNEALVAMKDINMNPVDAWWHERLTQGEVLPDFLAWCTKPDNERWPSTVSSRALFVSLTLSLRERNVRMHVNEPLLANQLARMTGRTLNRAQRYYHNPLNEDAPREVRQMSERQNSITNLPDLTACRKAFQNHVGHAVDWPADATPEETPAYDRAHTKF